MNADSITDRLFTREMLASVERGTSLIARFERSWPLEMQLSGDEAVSVFDCHPWFFLGAFPPLDEERIDRLSVAVRLFARSLILVNPVSGAAYQAQPAAFAQACMQLWQAEGYRLLHGLFPSGSQFWVRFNDLLSDYARATLLQQEFVTGGRSWTEFDQSVAREIATKRAGIGKVSILALAELSGNDEPVESLLLAADEHSFATQMLVDLQWWREQVRRGVPSFYTVGFVDGALPERHGDHEFAPDEAYDRVAQRSSRARVLLSTATALNTAAELAAVPPISWQRLLETSARVVRQYAGQCPDIAYASRAGAAALVLEQPTWAHAESGIAWKGLRMLIDQWSDGFSEAAHTMSFPRSQGFSGPVDEQTGDVFQRALILDVLCDANALFGGKLSDLLEQEVDYLLSCRRQSGIGGWSYFPALLELPPDADDLAQLMQAFLRCGRTDAVADHCEKPLATLLTDNSRSDGSFETWIIPRQRSREQSLQAYWIDTAWGWGADCDVVANMLYALSLYDPSRFAHTLTDGRKFLASAQQQDGTWNSTWYEGPFYCIWVCVRLLDGADGGFPAVTRARNFLLSRQRDDGGWGRGEQSDPLSTAFALLGLGPEHANRQRTDAALEYLRQTQQDDGGWPQARFIRMELGRPTGNPWQIVHYGSRTITTTFVVKACLRFSGAFAAIANSPDW